MASQIMEQVLAEEWVAYSMGIVRETGGVVAVAQMPREPVTPEQWRLAVDAAEARARYMGNALRMARLIRQMKAHAHASPCACWFEIDALLRDLDLLPEPAEAGR